LLLPDEAGVLRTLGVCTFCAFAMTILYVSVPLFMLNIFVPLGRWFGVVVCGSFVSIMAALVFFSMHETRHLRRVKNEL
jgi:hypothetical protein